MEQVTLRLTSTEVSASEMEELLETLRPLLALIYRDRVITTTVIVVNET